MSFHGSPVCLQSAANTNTANPLDSFSATGESCSFWLCFMGGNLGV